MFRYQLKQNPIQETTDSFMEDYLRRLGIQKISSFLGEPKPEDELNPFLLNRMEEGITMLYNHLTRGSNLYLVVDSDVDGYSSAAIMYNFIKELRPDIHIEYYIHPEKEHGVVPSTVSFGTGLVIIPDAGSNQYEELQELQERNVDVLVLDHHLVEDHQLFIHPSVVIINNQISPQFPNKSLSGAGVVYKFVQAYLRTHPSHFTYEKYSDLAMFGILSDMMLITELDNNYIIRKGLGSVKNKMMLALLKKQSYSVSSTTNPNIIDIVFYVTPVVNGTIRMGSLQEKMNLFEAFVDQESTEIFSREWRGETINENLYDRIARESYNIKEKQNRITLKTMERICEAIEKDKLYENQVIVYKTSKADINDVPKALTGLVAMKILQKYNRPTLILRPTNNDGKWIFRGSGRGKKAEGFLSFKDFLSGSGLVEYAQGHDMAFGTGIEEDTIPALVEYANTTLSNVDFGTDTIEVDYIFNNENLDSKMLYEFADHMHLYGNGIPQPLFAFELVLQPSNFYIMGKNKDTVKISYGGVNFIKFKSSEWAETISYNMQFPIIKTTIIGRAQINEFNGNRSTQLIIDHMDVQELDVGDLL
jgi:single-stranded-DNA-specific exonuclease